MKSNDKIRLKVEIDRHPVRFYVYKRPHVDYFLNVVSQWYELVVFTASMEIYGAAVADKLDNNRRILNRRFYRQVIIFFFQTIYQFEEQIKSIKQILFH